MYYVPVIGDAHFKSDARQQDRLAAVMQIVSENVDQPVGCWVIPGDLYDGSSDAASRNAWLSLIAQMLETAHVVICYGNHDRDGDLSKFQYLSTPRYQCFVIDRPETITMSVPDGCLSMFVLPYPHPWGFVATGVASGDLVAAGARALDDIFMEASVKLDEARALGHDVMMVGHANVAGSVMSTGQPLIGKEIELDPKILARLGSCPKVLNHIHKPQEIADAVHVGSVTAMSWGEIESKRYIRVRFGDNKMKGPYVVESIGIVTPRLFLIEATYEGPDHVLTYHEWQPADVPPSADVRVRVRFKMTQRRFFEDGRAKILEQFAHARRCQIEPVCEPDGGLRSEAVAQATTLLAKVEAWAADAGLALPAQLADSLGALETQHGEDVYLHTRQQLARLESRK